jgi:PemK-like, MazF-like toxin of type II toxin-antitoxin system
VIGGPPKIGFVIRYVYDWSENDILRTMQSEKERPAVIILSIRRNEDIFVVRVAPITHREPQDLSRAIELPRAIKERLGLDGERSWVILDHANEFQWPGPDVRPVPGREPTTIYYGPLPPAFYAKIRNQLIALLKAGRIRGLFRRG